MAPASSSTPTPTRRSRGAGGPVCSFLYCGFNAAQAPFDKKEARQAVAWAIDRQQVGRPSGERARSEDRRRPDRTESLGIQRSQIYTAPDCGEGKALLAEAGVTQGAGLCWSPRR